jgi:hypothetical protein
LRKLLAVGAVLLAVVVPAACSSADDDPREGSSGTTASDSSATTGADGDGASGSGDPGEGEVLGSASASLPADPNDDTPVPLRLDVVALERLSGRVEARFVLTNEGEAGGANFEPWSSFVDPRLAADEAPWSLAGASLIDGEAQKAYLTIIDSEGVCLCSGELDVVVVAPGDSTELYADFGGVPDDVEQLDVQVPGFSPVTEVPLS